MLAAIALIAWWTTTLDAPIRAPLSIEVSAIARVGEERVQDPLPLGDWPCAGPRTDRRLTCTDQVAVRTDLDLDLELRPLFGADGAIHAGGPRSPDRGLLVYDLGGELRFTTSERTARRVVKEARTATLYFGYER